MKPLLTWLALALAATPAAEAQTKASKLFAAKTSPSRQSPAAVGAYNKGCLAGAEQLPGYGPTWAAMKPGRNRHWGHPEMIRFLKDFSATVAAEVPGWRGLYISDISQPRGGPVSGHQSHQLGLDVDIWLKRGTAMKLSRAQREGAGSYSVRSRDQRSVNENWTPQHMEVLKIAASDPRVDRIFITAPAKIWMCKNARGDKRWLQKIRPLWGHYQHFHVRLKCPAGARGCVTQKPTVKQLSKNATGCDETLNWWVTEALDPPKKKPSTTAKPKKKVVRRKRALDFVMADLPRACQGVLTSR